MFKASTEEAPKHGKSQATRIDNYYARELRRWRLGRPLTWGTPLPILHLIKFYVPFEEIYTIENHETYEITFRESNTIFIMKLVPR